MITKVDLKNLNQEQLISFVESLGQPPFRGRQIMSWLYRPGVTDFEQMTDLAKVFRKLLAENCCISCFENPHIERSQDGCVKFAFQLEDKKIIESVLIPEDDRNTLCVSSQVGCAMGCSFCLTGTMGFSRNLSSSEIVNQVCYVRDFLLSESANELIGPKTITNLVFMGMGEPLNNMDHLLVSLSILTEQKGLNIASRKITVSTCGIVPKLRTLGENSSVNLAISLHAANDRTRNQLMPINQTYPISELIQACRDFPMSRRKRIMFEYILLKDINDSDQDAVELAQLLADVPCKINLLPYNESRGLPYKSPDRERILGFQDILRKAHYSVFIRNSRGSDISAACGQLASDQRIDKPAPGSKKQ